MDGKYDQTFMGILQEEGQVIPFLDSLFGFLYRRTDFFRLQNDPSDKLGFPPGVAEQIVVKVLRKWETRARLDEENYYKLRNKSVEEEPHSIREEVVETETVEYDSQPSSSLERQGKEIKDNGTKKQCVSDSYNGAVRQGYQWSQTISDLDVQNSADGLHFSRKVQQKTQLSLDQAVKQECSIVPHIHSTPE